MPRGVHLVILSVVILVTSLVGLTGAQAALSKPPADPGAKPAPPGAVAPAEPQPPAQTWIERGPDFGGRLSAIVASPQSPDTLLVASPGGGVWRTFDGGASWHRPANYGLGDFSVFHLEWDRIDPSRLLAVTWSDVYASADLADHWTNLTGLGGFPVPLMPFTHHSDPKPFAQLKLSGST